MNDIHPTAIVEDGARIGENVRIGAYSMIGADVELGDGVIIHPHVVVEGRTRIGPATEIFPFAGVGGRPQDTSYKDEPTEVEIGANCIIREHATVHRGTARGRGKTTIGAQCFLMIGAHVAHDCVLGDHVVLVNSATLGGHVEIGEHAILGGLAAVQQRTRDRRACLHRRPHRRQSRHHSLRLGGRRPGAARRAQRGGPQAARL